MSSESNFASNPKKGAASECCFAKVCCGIYLSKQYVLAKNLAQSRQACTLQHSISLFQSRIIQQS